MAAADTSPQPAGGEDVPETGRPFNTRPMFLYRQVLGVELPWLDDVVRAKRPQRLPVALTRAEVRAVLQRLDGVPRLMAILLYGAGPRLLACCRLPSRTPTSRPISCR